MNKKKIILFVFALLFVVLVVLLLFYQQSTSVGTYSKKFKTLTIDNGLANQSDFVTCKRDASSCISLSSLFIKSGLRLRANYINYDLLSLDKELAKITLLINKQDFKEALTQSQETINKVKQAYLSYLSSNQKTFDAIDKAIENQISTPENYAQINYRLQDGWAVVTLLPKLKGDPANVVLQNSASSGWLVKLGPGSYFDQALLDKYPEMPPQIRVEANVINPTIIVYNEKKGKPKALPVIIDQTKEISVDPLFERLPYITDTFTVEGELVNGLPIYTVSYAKTEKNTLGSIKNDFRSWLKEINVTVNESLVEYVPVEPNDNSKSLE